MTRRPPLSDRLKQGPPILLDGATGTELARRGVDLNSPSWTAGVILDQPELLRAVHRDYVAAGAEILTANTFRTHSRSLKSLGREREAARLTERAVTIAREAAGENCYVAGSVAPLEDCYSPQLTPSRSELIAEHAAMAQALAESGVDLILIETQVTIREAVIAAEAAAHTGLPFWVSFTCDRAGRILSGEPLAAGLEAIAGTGAQALLVNCIPVEEVLGLLEPIRTAADRYGIPLGAYANTGRLLPGGTWEATRGAESAVYAEFSRRWREQGLACLGGCCGTTPQHISDICKMLCGDS